MFIVSHKYVKRKTTWSASIICFGKRSKISTSKTNMYSIIACSANDSTQTLYSLIRCIHLILIATRCIVHIYKFIRSEGRGSKFDVSPRNLRSMDRTICNSSTITYKTIHLYIHMQYMYNILCNMYTYRLKQLEEHVNQFTLTNFLFICRKLSFCMLQLHVCIFVLHFHVISPIEFLISFIYKVAINIYIYICIYIYSFLYIVCMYCFI